MISKKRFTLFVLWVNNDKQWGMNQNSLSFYFGILCIFCSSKIFIAVYIIITDYLQEREKSPCIPGLLSTSYLIIHQSACEFDLHTTIQDPSQRHKRDPRSTTFLHPPHSSPAKHRSDPPASPLCSQCKPCFAHGGESYWFLVSLHLDQVFSTSLKHKLCKIEAWESTLHGSSFLKELVQMSVIDSSTGYDHCKCLLCLKSS